MPPAPTEQALASAPARRPNCPQVPELIAQAPADRRVRQLNFRRPGVLFQAALAVRAAISVSAANRAGRLRPANFPQEVPRRRSGPRRAARAAVDPVPRRVPGPVPGVRRARVLSAITPDRARPAATAVAEAPAGVPRASAVAAASEVVVDAVVAEKCQKIGIRNSRTEFHIAQEF